MILLVAAVSSFVLTSPSVCQRNTQNPTYRVDCLSEADFPKGALPPMAVDFIHMVENKIPAGAAIIVNANHTISWARLGMRVANQTWAINGSTLLPLNTFKGYGLGGLGRDISITAWSGQGQDQIYYGPPVGPGSYACSGFESRDMCKSCCQTAGAQASGGLTAFAVACHTFFAVTWVGHLGCGIGEGVTLGAILYYTYKCNDNCEVAFVDDSPQRMSAASYLVEPPHVSMCWDAVRHSYRACFAPGGYGL